MRSIVKRCVNKLKSITSYIGKQSPENKFIATATDELIGFNDELTLIFSELITIIKLKPNLKNQKEILELLLDFGICCRRIELRLAKIKLLSSKNS